MRREGACVNGWLGVWKHLGIVVCWVVVLVVGAAVAVGVLW